MKQEKGSDNADEMLEKKVRLTRREWQMLWRKYGGRKGLSVSNFLRGAVGLAPLKWGGQNKKGER